MDQCVDAIGNPIVREQNVVGDEDRTLHLLAEVYFGAERYEEPLLLRVAAFAKVVIVAMSAAKRVRIVFRF
jgi:hypothetical protein